MYAEELVGGLNIVDDGVGELVFVLPGDVADDGLLWMKVVSAMAPAGVDRGNIPNENEFDVIDVIVNLELGPHAGELEEAIPEMAMNPGSEKECHDEKIKAAAEHAELGGTVGHEQIVP